VKIKLWVDDQEMLMDTVVVPFYRQIRFVQMNLKSTDVHISNNYESDQRLLGSFIQGACLLLVPGLIRHNRLKTNWEY